jgi:5-methylcytosine-specific restriction endonuclease McrA
VNAAQAKRIGDFKKNITKFVAWLSTNGAEVLAVTNEWEIVRFRANGDLGVIYKNKVGRLTFQGSSEEAAMAFINNTPWRGNKATKRRTKGSVIARTLIKRDGSLCFFCQLPMSEDNQSVEHLVAVTHGGPNHMSNFVLAHRGCNSDAGHLSAMEKIRIHVNSIMLRSEQS